MNELSQEQLEQMMEKVLAGLLEKQKVAMPGNIDELVKAMAKFGPPVIEKAPEAGRQALKYIRAVGASRVLSKGTGELQSPFQYAKTNYGEDDVVTKAMAATVFQDGGALIPPDIAADFIELLRPASVVRAMGPVIQTMPRGMLAVPKITGGATFTWIGENQNLQATGLQSGNVNLTAKKGGAVLPISNDLLRRADSNADMTIRDDLVASLSQGSDLAYIRGTGTLYAPKGLRYWAPAGNLIGTAGTTLDQVTTDLRKAMLALTNANVRMIRPGWLMSARSAFYLMFIRDGNGNYAFRDEMLTGRLNGYPFRWTTQIPDNLSTNQSELYFVDFADVVIGDSLSITIDISTEAAYFDGSNVVSAWSLDQSVLRALIETDLVMRHAESVAVITGITWGA